MTIIWRNKANIKPELRSERHQHKHTPFPSGQSPMHHFVVLKKRKRIFQLYNLTAVYRYVLDSL